MIQELKSKAAKHWREYLPEMWAKLMAEDRVDEALNQAARAAEKEIRRLMALGMRLDEAEEVVLPKQILLNPEPEEEDEESAEMERAYMRTVGIPTATYLQDADAEYERERAEAERSPAR